MKLLSSNIETRFITSNNLHSSYRTTNDLFNSNNTLWNPYIFSLQRGKFYPQLSYLIKVNTPRAVMQETKKAFRKLPNIESAMTALSNLKGVGTATASALLAAASPDIAPFMADECVQAIPEMEGSDYTAKEYLNFVNHIRNVCDRLNKVSLYSAYTYLSLPALFPCLARGPSALL